MNRPELVAANDMPDIAGRELLQPQATLDWVGMSGVHQPLRIRDGGETCQVQASAQVYVDLADTTAKGIHMSRLYLILDEHASTRALTAPGLKLLLASVLESHHGLSSRAFVQFEFDYPLRRRALVSDNSGWNSYPALIKGTLMDGKMHLEVGVGIYYSSTCPCSAALARQLVQSKFEADFGRGGTVSASKVKAWLGTEEGILATPHSQRSMARILAKLKPEAEDFPIRDLIDAAEAQLGTPVQAAVKREDEQEFARLNGQNPMFVEDAGRKLKAMLLEDGRLEDFWVRLEHYESLHAHNAVGVFTKGVQDGYLPIP